MKRIMNRLFLILVAITIAQCKRLASLSKFEIDKIRHNLYKVVTAAALFTSTTTGSQASQIQINHDKLCQCNACNINNALLVSVANTNAESWYNPTNQRIFDTKRMSFIPSHPEIYLKKVLGDRNVVIIGEVHSNPCHHKVEFEVLRTLYDDEQSKGGKLSNIAIGMEAFYRQHQKVLDDFIFVHKDFDLLQKKTNWAETWGYDLNYYSKILRYASDHNIRVIGLNVPQPVAHYVSQKGLENVPESLRKRLPDEIDIGNICILLSIYFQLNSTQLI